jgi:hypothetical protein
MWHHVVSYIITRILVEHISPISDATDIIIQDVSSSDSPV